MFAEISLRWTGIAFLTPTSFTSTSTDQRVVLWHINVQDAIIDRVNELVTQVADTADLDALPTREGEWIVAVAGAGLEMISIK